MEKFKTAIDKRLEDIILIRFQNSSKINFSLSLTKYQTKNIITANTLY